MVTCIKCKEEVPAWWHIAGLCLGCRASDSYTTLECAECEEPVAANNAVVVNGIRIMCRKCWQTTRRPMRKPRFVLNNNLGWDMTMFLTPRGTIHCPRCRREWDIRAPLDNKSVEIASPYCPQCVNFLLSYMNAPIFGSGLSQKMKETLDKLPAEFKKSQEEQLRMMNEADESRRRSPYRPAILRDEEDDLKKMWGDTEAPFK